MDELRQVLDLISGARERYTTAHMTVRTTGNPTLGLEAMQRWTSMQPKGSVGWFELKGRGELPKQPDEHIQQVWFEQPSRWRSESYSPAGVSIIMDGILWWSYSPHFGAETNVGTPNPELVSTSIGSYIVHLLDPAPLVSVLEFQVLRTEQCAGRAAIRVRAETRELDLFQAHRALPLPYVREYELLVDTERGVLLRMSALLDGEEFLRTEVVSIAFDEQFDEGVFRLELPPRVEMRVFEPRVAPHGGSARLRRLVGRALDALHWGRSG